MPVTICRSFQDPQPSDPSRTIRTMSALPQEGQAIDWDTPLTVSRSLALGISPTGSLTASTSISRRPQHLEADAIPVLMELAKGASPRQALASLQEEWEIDEDGFTAVVETLRREGFVLERRDGEERRVEPARGGFASVISHHHMLRDPVRVMAYQSAITRHAAGKVVVEVGCGTGILSIFAARAGARRVIAIEESGIADVAEEMLAANGCADRVELRRANSRDVELDEQADLIVHEILGSDPFDENLLPVIRDAAERFLGPGGRLLPQAVEVLCAGVELPERPYLDQRRVLKEIDEYSGLYGIDFSPVRSRLETLSSSHFPLALGSLAEGPNHLFSLPILTEECHLHTINLHEIAPGIAEPAEPPRLRIRQEGLLGGVVLYFRAHLDDELRLTTSPFAPRTHWGWIVRPFAKRQNVAPGDEIAVRARLEDGLGKQHLEVELAG